MVNVFKNKMLSFFTQGHERTIKAKKNIAISFLIKGLNIAIGLVLVPLTISYVNPTQYGIWLTLSSIISWFSFFDIGLGNGLKNKLVEANSHGEHDKLKIYVSTTYSILIIISICFFIIFFIFNRYINWATILNVPKGIVIDFELLTITVFAFFCVQFILQLLNVVLTACHVPVKVSFIAFLGQLLSLIALYFFTLKHNSGTIISLVLIVGGLPLLVHFIASIWYYKHSYKEYAPSFKFINFKYAKDLLSIGGVFFIIQIGALILFQTDNIVITQLFGPQQVTIFNVAFKLFSIIIMVLNIILTPFWAAFTEAYAKNDMAWIKAVLSKMKKIWLLLSLGTIILFFAAPYLYKAWLHQAIQVPLSLNLVMAVYVMAYGWQTIHVFLLNGIGKIRLQLYLVIFSSIVNIPLAIFLGKKMGLAGVTLSNAILFIIMSVFFYFQTNKIVSGNAKGILNA